MPTCEECKSFFAFDEDPLKGDCVTREKDQKSSYWISRPTDAFTDTEGCPRFISRDDNSKKVEDLAEEEHPIVDYIHRG